MKAEFRMIQRFLTICFCVTALLGTTLVSNAQAQNNNDFMPPRSTVQETAKVFAPNEATHPALRLTPDRSEMIRLNKDAASIIIGNESNIQILMDTPSRLIVVPREPGATFFTILDKGGDIIMQRHAIVASPKEKYVRIRRSCRTAGGTGCEETSIYYCPGMCHDVKIQTNINGSMTRKNLLPAGASTTADPASYTDPATGTTDNNAAGMNNEDDANQDYSNEYPDENQIEE